MENIHKKKSLTPFRKGSAKNPRSNIFNSYHINQKLKESEIRYRRLFETAQDGILILDFETGEITDANPYIIQIIESSLKDIRGKKLWEIGLFNNKEISEQTFMDLKNKGFVRFENLPISGKNGTLTEVEFISNVYLANETKVIQCNIRNISERKQIENKIRISELNLKYQNEEYRRLNDNFMLINKDLTESLSQIQTINQELHISKAKAEESDLLKSAFLSNMSHEIRTPMNAILGFSKFLLDRSLPPEKIENYVQIINSSSQQLLSIISDIIDISKIETGQIKIDSEVVNINVLLTELFTTYLAAIEKKKLTLIYKNYNSKEIIEIKSDGNRIKQILSNLLNNAIKFTLDGSIEFGYILTGDFIKFYVSDTGIGIAHENQERIFSRFIQVESNPHAIYGGNGLGLSISKALVEKLGGKIQVTSNIGQGTSFSFTIPYVKEKYMNSIKKTDIMRAPNWANKTILLVEDEVYNHVYMEEILASTHVKIEHAWNGKEAVEQVISHTYISLVLMDIKLPIMNGFESMRQIKVLRPHLPVIAQTAFALSEDRKNAIHAGFDDYISKPIDESSFITLISQYIYKMEPEIGN